MAHAWWVSSGEIASPKYPLPGPQLLLQRGIYHFTDQRPPESGYRFIWRLANGQLQGRGAARIDSIADIQELICLGIKEENWKVTKF